MSEIEVKQNASSMDDAIDRVRAGVIEKLEYICDKAREMFGLDPRAGGFSFVGHPQVVEQVLAELGAHASKLRTLQKPVIVGSHDGDVVMWWHSTKGGAPSGIPFRTRHHARFPNLWIMPDGMMRPSDIADRKAAAEIRMNAWKGEIRLVQ